MSISTFSRLGALALALSATGMVNAASIVSSTATFTPSTELITFDGYDGLQVSNPLYLDNDGDVLFTSSNAVLGQSSQDLEGNGLWGARFAGTSTTGEGNFLSAYAPVMFNFGADGPQAQVAAYFNLSQAMQGNKTNSLTFTAFNESMVALESFSYLVNTAVDGYNEGVFLGFARQSADIYSFGVVATAGSALVMDNLSLSTAPVPEPETYGMLLAGLAAVVAAVRRRRRA